MARKRRQRYRKSQLIFVILSLLVVISRAIGYVIAALPAPPPPTPTPTLLPTPTAEVLWAPLLRFLA